MASFKESQRSQAGSSLSAPKITAANFLGRDGFPGYDTPEGFLVYGQKLTPSDEENLRKLIGFTKEGLKSDGGSDIRKDVAGRPYQYFTFYKPRSRPGAKLILSPGLLRFMSDYQNGLITVDFTLDDLINEAIIDSKS